MRATRHRMNLNYLDVYKWAGMQVGISAVADDKLLSSTKYASSQSTMSHTSSLQRGRKLSATVTPTYHFIVAGDHKEICPP